MATSPLHPHGHQISTTSADATGRASFLAFRGRLQGTVTRLLQPQLKLPAKLLAPNLWLGWIRYEKASSFFSRPVRALGGRPGGGPAAPPVCRAGSGSSRPGSG